MILWFYEIKFYYYRGRMSIYCAVSTAIHRNNHWITGRDEIRKSRLWPLEMIEERITKLLEAVIFLPLWSIARAKGSKSSRIATIGCLYIEIKALLMCNAQAINSTSLTTEWIDGCCSNVPSIDPAGPVRRRLINHHLIFIFLCV